MTTICSRGKKKKKKNLNYIAEQQSMLHLYRAQQCMYVAFNTISALRNFLQLYTLVPIKACIHSA